MSISEARLAANRRNALRSTGPRTEDGKACSSRNALKHGLTSAILDFEVGLDPALPSGDRPASMSRAWLSEQVARTMGQIDRGQRIEAQARLQAARRAMALWDEDRYLEVENIAASLAREPSRTVARLRQTPQGCDRLIGHWDALARAAEADPAGEWTADQTRQAFDLLGTPEADRTERVEPAQVRGSRGPDRPCSTCADLARSMIDLLKAHRVNVADADQIARSLAESDESDTPTHELARVRRYDLALHRRLQWLLGELRTSTDLVSSDPPSPHRDPSPTPPPAPATAPPVPPAEAPRPVPVRNELTPSEAPGETNPSSATPSPRDLADTPVPPPRNNPKAGKTDRKARQKRNRQLRDRRRA